MPVLFNRVGLLHTVVVDLESALQAAFFYDEAENRYWARGTAAEGAFARLNSEKDGEYHAASCRAEMAG